MKFRPQLKTVPIFTLLITLLIAVPLLTQQEFSEREVLPRNCKSGQLMCFGLEVESQEEIESVPADRANFVRHRGLPSRVDLTGNFPPVGYQGRQGSCVAWTTAYAIKSYEEQVEHRWGFDAGGSVRARCGAQSARIFSPAFVYNQINGGRDKGSSIRRAFQLMTEKGAAPCSHMPYDATDYLKQPDRVALEEAAKYRARELRRIDCSGNTDAVKAVLAQGLPLAAGFKVDKNLRKLPSNAIWDRFDPPVLGGHAMAVVGYDDNKTTREGQGAFRIMNSWGDWFGEKGFLWISYGTMRRVCKYAYVLYDQQEQKKEKPTTTVVEQKMEPPLRVQASQGSFPDKIVITWESVAGAVAYQVERAAGNSHNFRALGYAQSISYTDTPVQPGIAFRYRIVSVGRGGHSRAEDSPVAEGHARIAKQPTPPGAVLGLQGSVAAGPQVILTWSKTTTADRYEIVRYDGRRQKWKTLSSRNTASSFTDRHPTGNAMNYYAVRAGNRSGFGPYGNPIGVNVIGRENATIPPPRVEGVNASQGIYRNRIVLSWNRVPGAELYAVLRYDFQKQDWELVGNTSGNGYEDTSSAVQNGAWFGYNIIGINKIGRGPFSDSVNGRTSPNASRGLILPPPENLTGKIDERQSTIILSWKRVAKAAEYYLYSRSDSGQDFEFVKAVKSNHAVLPIVQKGVLYLFSVRSKSMLGGESGDSNIVSGFVNERHPQVRHRFLPGEGLQNFTGDWLAYHLSNTAARKIALEIKDLGNGSFRADVSVDGGRSHRISGMYAARSRSLMSGGFKMDLLDSGAARVHFSNRALYPERLTIVFTR